MLHPFHRSCRGVVDKPLALYPGVSSLIPGFLRLLAESLSSGLSVIRIYAVFYSACKYIL